MVECFLPELDSSKDLILEKIRENVPSQTNFGHISTVSKMTNPGKPEVLNIDSKGLRDFCSIFFGSPRISGKDLKISQRFLIYNIYTCTDHWKSHAGENKPISRTWHRINLYHWKKFGVHGRNSKIESFKFQVIRKITSQKKFHPCAVNAICTRHLCDSHAAQRHSPILSCNLFGIL